MGAAGEVEAGEGVGSGVTYEKKHVNYNLQDHQKQNLGYHNIAAKYLDPDKLDKGNIGIQNLYESSKVIKYLIMDFLTKIQSEFQFLEIIKRGHVILSI